MDKNRLGKGLGALLSENKGDETKNVSSSKENTIVNLYVEKIKPNPFQPRQEFDHQSLEELASSIKENGVLQPITVRKAKPEVYQLVTGERRWRACKLIGVKKVPAIVKDYSDNQMMEIALIENLQREDLNPIEEAQAYKTMIEEFDLTQEKVAKKVGKSRSSIANVVRLLNLAPKVQMFVSRETITMGHARALLSLDNNDLQIKAAEHVMKNNLSVRETEKYISRIKNKNNNKNDKKEEKSKKQNSLDEKWLKAKQRMSSYLDTEVEVKNQSKNKKVFSITFKNYNDVEKLLSKLDNE